ncbi:unnamed protein product [Phaedon cochleariae]|uniref:Uncharacterized protein n=1 Tax=Phaedon cochleariae TaxID=80249 RepID=A0A9N9SD19_PHACE|nr:unnamed protein product [Phaedon cochleariae]
MPKTYEKTLRSISSSLSKNEDFDSKTQAGEFINEHLEKIIEKVCEKVVASLDAKMDARFEKFNQNISIITANLGSVEKIVHRNEDDLRFLRSTIDHMERKNSLRINGLPENGRRNPLEMTIRFIRETLKVKCDPVDISDVFRIEKPYHKTGARTTLVKFVTTLKRTEVYLAKKMLKNSGIRSFQRAI